MGAVTLSGSLVAVTLLAAGCGTTGSPGDSALERGVVSAVTDGDTLRLRDGRRVRLLQIDAPEAEECFAQGSTKVLGQLARSGAQVMLERDPRLDVRDDYGRLLRYVRVAGGNVNLELVRRGAAVPYFFRGERGVYARELLDAAKEARRERRGLWRACPHARLDPNRGALTGPARQGLASGQTRLPPRRRIGSDQKV